MKGHAQRACGGNQAAARVHVNVPFRGQCTYDNAVNTGIATKLYIGNHCPDFGRGIDETPLPRTDEDTDLDARNNGVRRGSYSFSYQAPTGRHAAATDCRTKLHANGATFISFHDILHGCATDFDFPHFSSDCGHKDNNYR